MRLNLAGAAWRLSIFLIVCALGAFALSAVFAQFRFGAATPYNAVFTNVSGLKAGNFVRVAGVEVGKVTSLTLNEDTSVRVAFTTDDTVVLTEGSRAVIRYDDLIGGRYLALEQGVGTPRKISPGETIPEARTQPALDLDTLIGGFRPLFRALNPDQVNALSGQLIKAFEGQGVTIQSFLSQTAGLTSTLADRDQLIGEVVDNLNTVLDSLGSQSGQLDKTVDSLSQLVHGLAERKTDVVNAIGTVDAASTSIADLLQQARPPTRKVVPELDRATSIMVADHDYLDNLINTLPDRYRTLNRLGLYGDYFSFYLCDLVLKLNGKGGQPVYVKVAGQSTGRCTPK